MLRFNLLRLIGIFLLLASVASYAKNGSISASEAIDHVGEHSTVCGVVASAKFAQRTNRQPTFLNLDKPYPDHVFTAVIWGEDRQRFSYQPESLLHKRICVIGRLELYRGRAEIIVRAPEQIVAK